VGEADQSCGVCRIGLGDKQLFAVPFAKAESRNEYNPNPPVWLFGGGSRLPASLALAKIESRRLRDASGTGLPLERVPMRAIYKLKEKEIEMTGLKIAVAMAVLFVLSAPANTQSRIGSAKSVKPDASGSVAGTLSAGSGVHADETVKTGSGGQGRSEPAVGALTRSRASFSKGKPRHWTLRGGGFRPLRTASCDD
jgi:hypothetical protein